MKCVRVKLVWAVAAGAICAASAAGAEETPSASPSAPEADPAALPSSVVIARENIEALLFAGRAAYEDSLFAIASRRFASVLESPDATDAEKAEAALWQVRTALAAGDLEAARTAWDASEGADAKERALEAYRIAEAAEDWAAAEAALAPFAGKPAEKAEKESPSAGETAESEIDCLLRRARLRVLEAKGAFDSALAALPTLSADGAEGLAERLDYAEALARNDRAEEAEKFLADLEAASTTPAVRERAFLARRRIVEAAGLEDTSPDAGKEAASSATGGEESPALAMERAKAEAETLSRRGAFDEAVSRLEAALSLPLPAADANALKQLAGETILRQGDVAAGARRIREAIAEIPDAELARASHLRLAERLMELGAWEEAEAEYRIHRGAYPDDKQALPGEAAALAAQGKWRAAAARYESAGLWKEAGEARFLAGEPEKAAEDFRAQADSLAEDGPERRAAVFREAKCLDEAGRTEAARAAYAAIAADTRDPHAPDAALQQAVLTARAGDAAKAVELLGALATAPDAGESIRRSALLARGKLLETTGETEAAYADFARLATEDGGETAEEADYRAARCLLALGLAEDGLKRLDQFVRAHPASPFRHEASFALAAAAYNAGDFARAERLFAELARDPDAGGTRAEALFWAGKAAEAGGAGLKANAYLNDLLALEGTEKELTAEALLLQGDVLSRLGRFDAAIVAFDDVITRFPQTRQAAEARGRKGDCQYTLGEKDPARLEEALLSYRTLAGEAQAADDLRIAAMYKVARTMERQGLEETALDHYMEAVYAFLQLGDATPEAAAWFTRAAYAAAAAKEAAGDWKGAAGIYGRVAEAGVPASEDAGAKRDALERTHWF